MTKLNLNVDKVLDGNIVKVTETYDEPRYMPRIWGNCEWECENTINEIKECCKIYVPKGDYKNLTTFEIDYDELTGKTLEEDREIFQKLLDKEFGEGEYEAFVLGAYIHSGTAFSVNKTGNHVCQWDSSQLGCIGLKKNVEDMYSAEHPDKVADMLTAAWEGEFNEYQVIDNLTDECALDDNGDYVSIVTADYKEAQEWCKKVGEKYGISFDNVTPIY